MQNLANDDPVTLGEISRRLDAFESRTQLSLKAIDDRISTHGVSRDYYEARHAAIVERVSDLENAATAAAGYRWALFSGVMVSFVAACGAIIAALVR